MNKNQQKVHPPKWANQFLLWYCHETLIDEIEGDLQEQYQKNYSYRGKNYADRKFITDVLRFFRLSSLKNTKISINTAIATNYIKTAFRVFKKEKAYTLTNVFGLSLGIVCSLFIYLWVQDELSYNQWPEEVDHIGYIRTLAPESNGIIRTWHTSPQPLRQVLIDNYPSIEKAALSDWGNHIIFKKGEENLSIHGVYASPDLFDIFSIAFIVGSYESIAENNNNIAISKNMASKLYGNEWQATLIVGQEIVTKDEERYMIAGVFEDIVSRSTLEMDFLLPYDIKLKQRPWMAQWGNFSNKLYVKLANGYSFEEATENIKMALQDHRDDGEEIDETIFVQRFADKWLYSEFDNGEASGGRIDYVNLLSLSAILILLLAGVNFTNLTTAKSSSRSKETGVRKVMGATRSSLKFQFLIEAILIAMFAYTIAIITVGLLLPYFNNLAGKTISLDFLSWEFGLASMAIILMIGISAGLYPAFYMSSLNPIISIMGIMKTDRCNVFFRRGLVVFQFVITIIMIVGSLTIYEQIQFIFNKNLGLDRSNVLKLDMGDIEPGNQYLTFRKELLDLPGIQSVTAVDQVPTEIGNSSSDAIWDGKPQDQESNFYQIGIDPDFIKTMNIKIKSGRDFDWSLHTDTSNFIINETAASLMGLADPVGVGLEQWDTKGHIIGVVEDFHLQSLKQPIEPLILRYDPYPWLLLVKTKPNETTEALTSLESAYKKFNPERTFDADFLDYHYKRRYNSEVLVGKLTGYFTIIALVISCLGLLSLVAYRTKIKTKEIGVRKVLGATLTSILMLIGREFFVLIAIAFLLAVPFSYLAMSKWLNMFEYRIDLNYQLFLIAGVLAMTITILTIGNHAIKAALGNPVDALKNE